MRVFALLVLLLIAAPMTRAQETWPPDPADIFAEGVEVVSVEVDEHWRTPTYWDDAAKRIEFTDEQTGEVTQFPYPEGVSEIGRIEKQSDGTLLVSSSPDLPMLADASWILDPQTGIYTASQSVCNGLAQQTAGDGEWLFITHQETGQQHLCFTETGQQSAAFPNDVIWWNDEPGRYGMILPSPNGEWVALVGFVGGNPDVNLPGRFAIYTYHTLTGKLNYMGAIRPPHHSLEAI